MCLVFATIFVVAMAPVTQAEAPEYPFRPARFGMQGIQMMYFVPRNLAPAIRSLEAGRPAEARPALEKAARLHPNDLFIYALWMEATPKTWDPELERLTRLHGADSADVLRLALLHFYRWSACTQPHSHTKDGVYTYQAARDWSELDLARKQADVAWKANRHPLAALLVYCPGIMSHDGMDYSLNGWEKFTNAMAGYAGKRAWAEYEKASKSGWHTTPPTELVPPGNRRPLSALLVELWEQSTAPVGIKASHVAAGASRQQAISRARRDLLQRRKQIAKLRAEKRAKLAYIDKWIKGLRAAPPVEAHQ